MEIKKSIKIIALSVVASMLFVGCGSSDDGTAAPVAASLTGTFVDAPVQGLTYKTASQSGFTDASGQFKYLSGEEVEFTLGNLSLGKGTAGALITPYTIAENNDTATNIALLLQNFDGNRSNGGVLDLSKLQDFNFTATDFNLSALPATIKGKIDVLFADNSFTAYRDDTNNTVLDETAVKSAMDTYIESSSIEYDKKFTQAYLDNQDFYAIDDLGPLIMRFNDGQLYYAGDSYEDNNSVLVVGAGYDGNFTIDVSGVAAYTLVDGTISIGYSGGAVTISTTVTELTDDYVKVSQTDGTEIRTATWYKDKTAAISNSITSQHGFGVEWIKGKSFFLNFDDGTYEMKFENGFRKIYDPSGNVVANNTPYTIDANGQTVVDESTLGNGDQISKIIAVEGDKITVKTWNAPTYSIDTATTQVRYLTKEAAIAALAAI